MIASGGGRGIDTHCFLEFGCCCCSAVVAFLVFVFEDFLLPDDGVDDAFVTREEESLIPFVGSLAGLLVELGPVTLFCEVHLVVVVVAVLCSLAALDPSMIVTLGAAEDLALDFPLDLDGEGVSRWISLGERWVTGHWCVCS